MMTPKERFEKFCRGLNQSAEGAAYGHGAAVYAERLNIRGRNVGAHASYGDAVLVRKKEGR